MIQYEIHNTISSDEFIDVLRRSTLAERRPVEDRPCIGGMLAHADLLVTAWEDGLLVGVACSVTDFHYCCYLSDLAVDQALQGHGIDRELIGHTREELGPKCKLILLSAPAAREYCLRIGFNQYDSTWIIGRDKPLK